MAVFILSNRKIILKKNKDDKDSFSNDEMSIPNFRIAKCNFDNFKEPTKAQEKSKNYQGRAILDCKILGEPNKTGYQEVVDILKKEKGLNDSELTSSNLSGTQKMFYDLYKEMSTTKSQNDVLIFIHGFAYTFDDELKAILTLKKLYIDNKDSPINHILFISWPASSSIFPLTYFDDRAASINSGNSLLRLFYFYTQFLKDIFADKDLKPCNQHIHLMAHSMGNRLLQSMLYSLKTENISRVIDQVVLLSADVSFRVFEEAEDSFIKLPLLANRISIYVNKKDNILGISQFSKNILSPRLGKMGPSQISKLYETVSIIDVTGSENNLLTSAKYNFGNHWNYLSSSEVQKDIVAVLGGTDQSLIANRKVLNNNSYILA
ncbi:alpha/beta hydrolase [Frigoriflavimonas asaccharolytica]|uniref:Esterase/lipase superfamily enzyme n=1 Tax=Frigoriflavimonas asaccharolytica TaxID=2735899 RepID=A0A8J8GAS2_9FLAO|nr:alpha/beta hydrolase [Frigoriflavimonas asaccharolytica]NRS93117.1 esterase/lipase superfamily enzyme [Frigoriflavimonas asaccharolytica]